MRGKKAKAIRKVVTNHAERVYNTRPDVQLPQGWQMAKAPEYKNFGTDAIPLIVKVAKGVPIRLVPNCGRAIYQKIKGEFA